MRYTVSVTEFKAGSVFKNNFSLTGFHDKLYLIPCLNNDFPSNVFVQLGKFHFIV